VAKKADSPDAFKSLLSRILVPQGFGSAVDNELRLELLGHLLDRYRHELKHKDGRISFDDFLQCKLFIDSDRVIVQSPPKFVFQGSGLRPLSYQAPLLLFLLANHRRELQVIEIIESFIDTIWNQLSPLDFKKTQTGVTRCYTNTRFAAHTLRDYGFLKFTRREAFKTWILSLPGFLVAARLLETRRSWTNPYSVPQQDKEGNFDLLPEIRDVWEAIEDYDDFQKCLASICEEDTDVFDTFDRVLRRAHQLLKGYWATIRNGGLAQMKRRKLSMEIIHELERNCLPEEFYEQFSACVCINDALERANPTSSPGPSQSSFPGMS